MNHPRSRRERRAVREEIIQHRKWIVTRIWHRGSYYSSNEREREWLRNFEWGKYAKYNLNCGCSMCHYSKYYSCKRRRRCALNRANSQAEFRRMDKLAGR
jgi:hypothetical protein